jgi:hypothetical protein
MLVTQEELVAYYRHRIALKEKTIESFRKMGIGTDKMALQNYDKLIRLESEAKQLKGYDSINVVSNDPLHRIDFENFIYRHREKK